MTKFQDYDYTGEFVDSLDDITEGLWLVTTRKTQHLWDLDRSRYARHPGPDSSRLPYDFLSHRITTIGMIPQVGGQSMVTFDDMSDPLVEQWRVSGTIESIERLHDARRIRIANALLTGIHLDGECMGPACWIHRPSDHALNDRPIYTDPEMTIFRMCEHNELHRDPDDLAFHQMMRRRAVVVSEDCDGCCRA